MKSTTELNKLEGAMDQFKIRLKKEFKCKDIKEARALLIKIQEKSDVIQNEFEVELKKFKEKWNEKLS